MSWYGNHSTLSRLVLPARLGIYRKMEPQQRAHLKCQLVHARVCKVIFQSSSDSGSENENENATQLNRTEQNWTALPLEHFPHLMYQHISIYFISALGNFDANANRCASREEFIKPSVERSMAMHDNDDDDKDGDEELSTSEGFLSLREWEWKWELELKLYSRSANSLQLFAGYVNLSLRLNFVTVSYQILLSGSSPN